MIHFHLPMPAAASGEDHRASTTEALKCQQDRVAAAIFGLTSGEHDAARFDLADAIEIFKGRQLTPDLVVCGRVPAQSHQVVISSRIGQSQLHLIDDRHRPILQ